MPRGRKRVMAVGVFDILHLGHLHYLQEARKLGDELVVVVATDEMVRKRKHQPIIAQEMRVEMVAGLKPVDEAVLGDPVDQLKSVERLRPDVIALGWDDYHNIAQLQAKLAERGLRPDIVRISKFDHDLDGTRKIIRRIFDSGLFTPPSAPDAPKAPEPTRLEAFDHRKEGKS